MYVLLVTGVFIALFCLPYYLSFKINNRMVRTVALLLVLLADSYCYVWGNVNGNPRYGVIHFVVGIVTLLLFFFKPLKQKWVTSRGA